MFLHTVNNMMVILPDYFVCSIIVWRQNLFLAYSKYDIK